MSASHQLVGIGSRHAVSSGYTACHLFSWAACKRAHSHNRRAVQRCYILQNETRVSIELKGWAWALGMPPLLPDNFIGFKTSMAFAGFHTQTTFSTANVAIRTTTPATSEGDVVSPQQNREASHEIHASRGNFLSCCSVRNCPKCAA